MKLFVLDSYDTGAYHADGTLVVLAESVDDACQLVAASVEESESGGNTYRRYKTEAVPSSYGVSDEETARRFTYLMEQKWEERPLDARGVVVFNYGCDC